MNSNYHKKESSGQQRRSFNGDRSDKPRRSKNQEENETKIDFENPDFWNQIEKEIFSEEISSKSKEIDSQRDSRPNNREKSFERNSNDRSRRFESKENNSFVKNKGKRNEKTFTKHEDNTAERRSYSDRSSYENRERNSTPERKNRRDNDQSADRNQFEKREYKQRDNRTENDPRERYERPQRNQYDRQNDNRQESARYNQNTSEESGGYRRKEPRDTRYNSRDSKKEERPQRKQYKEKSNYEEQNNDSKTIRLNRFISNAGVCSRRDADDLILAGEILVNGSIVTELGCKVSYKDEITYKGKKLDPQKKVYLVLNKPKDTLSTFDDPEGRRTVYDIIEGATKERIYTVGRLDRNTTGVLLFTNNGEMATALTHPSNNIKKLYHVVLNKDVTKDHLKKLNEGFDLEDGPIVADEASYANDVKNEIGIEIHSGRNRIVRRMFEHLGYDVVRLDRVSFAGITKKAIPRGTWRMLESNEVNQLHMLIGKSTSLEKQNAASKGKRPRIEKEKKEFKHERRPKRDNR